MNNPYSERYAAMLGASPSHLDVGKVHSVSHPRASREPKQWVVEEIGAKGACVLLAADKGSGKTSLLYQMANAITQGQPFLGQLKTEQKKVLVIQGDESRLNAVDKLDAMGIETDFDFLFPEECGWIGLEMIQLQDLIRIHGYGAVLLDSVTTLLGNGSQGIKMNDPEFAAPLYALNHLASATGTLVMITSHLRKSESQPHKAISTDDVLGAGTLTAAVSDIWSLQRHQNPEFVDHFILRCLGKRNSQIGTAWNLQGSQEDFSWVLKSLVDPSDLLPARKRELKEKIVELLNNHDGLLHATEIAARLSCDAEHARRTCRTLASEESISRSMRDSTGGRPAWLYGKRTFPT